MGPAIKSPEPALQKSFLLTLSNRPDLPLHFDDCGDKTGMKSRTKTPLSQILQEYILPTKFVAFDHKFDAENKRAVVGVVKVIDITFVFSARTVDVASSVILL